MDIEVFVEKELAAAKHFITIKRYDEAENHINNILKNDPEHIKALVYLGLIYYRRNQYTEVRNIYEQLLKYDGLEVVCYYYIAYSYRYEGKLREAEEAFLEGLRYDPEDVDLLSGYGELMLITGYKEKGIKLIKMALEINPNSEAANQILLKYYLATSNRDKQKKQIENLMEYGNDEIRKLVNLALFHSAKGDYKKAKEYYVQAYLLEPTNKDLLELVQIYEEATHPLNWMHHISKKLGGPAVLWVGLLILIVILAAFGLEKIATVLVGIYVILALLSWINPFLYKLFVRKGEG